MLGKQDMMIEKQDELGFSLYNSEGHMKSLGEIVAELRKKIQSFGGDQKDLNNYLKTFDPFAPPPRL